MAVLDQVETSLDCEANCGPAEAGMSDCLNGLGWVCIWFILLDIEP